MHGNGNSNGNFIAGAGGDDNDLSFVMSDD